MRGDDLKLRHQRAIGRPGAAAASASVGQAEMPRTAAPGYWRPFHIGFWLLMLSWAVLTLAKTRWRIDSAYLDIILAIRGQKQP